jgi:transglutaminase-like putative cysteine protease
MNWQRSEIRDGLRRTGLFVICLVAFCCAAESIGRASEPNTPASSFRARPEWVELATPEYDAPNPASSAPNGVWILLYDRQINVRPAGDDLYVHYAAKLRSAAAVDQSSQISVSIDPSWQSLEFHTLQLVRGGEAIDLRRLARITSLPVETDLQARIYSGTVALNVMLSDVRIGDVVEYAYTIHSRDTLYPGHFSTRLPMAWGTPVLHQRVRLRAPADHALQVRTTDGRAAPPGRRAGAIVEYDVDRTNTPAIPSDEDAPAWYEPRPAFEASDIPSWPEAARMAAHVYGVPKTPGPLLAAVAASIRASGKDRSGLTLTALQYVQDQIRYTSIPIGPGDFRPADPEITLERRFGDCKDKSVLLIALIRQFGIEARPALVHSRRGRSLDTSLPTPYAFDHMIVKATIDETVYWLDATMPKQYAPLAPGDPGRFERALVVDDASGSLEVMPKPSVDARLEEVELHLDARAGLEAPATLDVTTRYFDGMADEIRPMLAAQSPEQRQVDYINYLARDYPDVKTRAPVTIEDDSNADVLTVQEHYALPHAFVKGKDGALELALMAHELRRFGTTLNSTVRTAPLAVEYPMHLRQLISVQLPQAWAISDDKVAIDDPAFRYRSAVSHASRAVTLTYDYQALADFVAASQVSTYTANRDRLFDDLSYRLTKNTRPPTPRRLAIAPAPFAAIALSILAGLWGAWRWWYRYDPEPASSEPNAPRGIRGWLTLPALSMIFAPIIWTGLIGVYGLYINADVWYTLPTMVPDAFRSWVQPLFLVLAGVGGVISVFYGTTAILFFRRRTSAPAFYILASWLAIFYAPGVEAFFETINLGDAATKMTPGKDLLTGCVRGVIWTAYMVRSRRVQATFVERLSSK